MFYYVNVQIKLEAESRDDASTKVSDMIANEQMEFGDFVFTINEISEAASDSDPFG